jgi:hypothetical protein
LEGSKSWRRVGETGQCRRGSGYILVSSAIVIVRMEHQERLWGNRCCRHGETKQRHDVLVLWWWAPDDCVLTLAHRTRWPAAANDGAVSRAANGRPRGNGQKGEMLQRQICLGRRRSSLIGKLPVFPTAPLGAWLRAGAREPREHLLIRGQWLQTAYGWGSFGPRKMTAGSQGSVEATITRRKWEDDEDEDGDKDEERRERWELNAALASEKQT